MPTYIDIETRSSCDLKTEGGRRYAVHPSTHLLTVAWITEGGENHVWFPTLEKLPPEGLIKVHLPNVVIHVGKEDPIPHDTLIAHNGWEFDGPVLEAKIGRTIDLDSLPLARAAGLPGSLNEIGKRLRGEGKFQEGKERLLKFCKAQNKPPMVGDLVMIAKYNLDDVVILKLLWDYLKTRPHREPEVLRVHRRVNDRGVKIDVPLCNKLLVLSEEATRRTISKINELTLGKLSTLEDLRSRNKMFDWLNKEQANVGTSLKKDTIETLFRHEEDEFDTEDGTHIKLNPLVREVLGLRFSALRISGAKVNAALQAAINGRLHDILVYYGAHTGRWAGRRFQPQNLPRPKPGVDVWKILDTDMSVEAILATLCGNATLDDAVSGLLRCILIPDDGYYFAGADYNAIEMRGIMWLAGCEKGLNYFRNGVCPYSAMAKRLYGREVTGKKDPIRQVGKTVMLGAQYQMSGDKLGLYSLAMGVDLEASGVDPHAAVEAYRDEFPELAGWTEDGYRRGGMWNELNYAALQACYSGRSEYRDIGFRHDGHDLIMWLPSGRPIYYSQAKVVDKVPKWGGKPKRTISYLSPRGFWQDTYGGKLAENCLTGDTQVLTEYGWINIIDVTPNTRVWDGVEWVHTSGVVNKGEQEIGQWLGIRLTGDHLIFDGNSWKSVIHLDEESTQRCLNSAVVLGDWLSSVPRQLGKIGKHGLNVIVGETTMPLSENYLGGFYPNAESVLRNPGPQFPEMPQLSPIESYDTFGTIDTQVLSLDAITKSAKPIQTTAAEVLGYTLNGEIHGLSFWNTLKPCLTGMLKAWTLTGSIMIGTTNPETFALSVEWRTPATEENQFMWSTLENSYTLSSLEPSIAPHTLTGQSDTISPEEKRRNRLWTSTGKTEKVYDLVNCGPRNRFMVLTNEGPVIVHNCTQASMRDVLADAWVREEDAGFKVPISVHDELVAMVKSDAEAKTFTEIMGTGPSWATGLPIKVEMDTMPRYAKEPPKGWYSYTYGT